VLLGICLAAPCWGQTDTPTPIPTLTPFFRPLYVPNPPATATITPQVPPFYLLGATSTPTGPLATPTFTRTPTRTRTSAPTPTPTCPRFCTISGQVFHADGTNDANDTITFFSGITHPVVLGGCLVNPMPPVSTTTDTNGFLHPIKLPQGLPVSVTLANGGGAPVQTYVPYAPTVDFGPFLTEASLGRLCPP